MNGLLLALLLSVDPDGGTRIAPASATSTGCDLRVAGMDDPKAFLRFFEELKTAAAAKDLGALNRLVSFPLRVSGKGSAKLAVKTPADLKKSFARVFTPDVLHTLAVQKTSTLFCRDQGVMYGNGQLWVAPVDQNGARSIRVTAVNLDAKPVP